MRYKFEKYAKLYNLHKLGVRGKKLKKNLKKLNAAHSCIVVSYYTSCTIFIKL
jgi:hypothetical protein